MTEPTPAYVLVVAVDGLPPAALEDAVNNVMGKTVTVGIADWAAQGTCTDVDVDVDGLLTVTVDRAEVRS